MGLWNTESKINHFPPSVPSIYPDQIDQWSQNCPVMTGTQEASSVYVFMSHSLTRITYLMNCFFVFCFFFQQCELNSDPICNPTLLLYYVFVWEVFVCLFLFCFCFFRQVLSEYQTEDPSVSSFPIPNFIS